MKRLDIRRQFPVVAMLDSSRPLVMQVRGTRSVKAEGLHVYLALHVAHAVPVDFALLIFVNTPGANASTPVDVPGFAGTMAFVEHSAGHHDTGSAVRLPISQQFRRTRGAHDLTATIVPVPFPGERLAAASFQVMAAVEFVSPTPRPPSQR